MTTRKKHAERSKRSHKQHADTRGFGLYRMAAITDRRNTIRSRVGNHRKGEM